MQDMEEMWLVKLSWSSVMSILADFVETVTEDS